MRLQSFRAWITIGMEMLSFKVCQEMFGPFQVSRPVKRPIGFNWSITGHQAIVCGFSLVLILTNVESSEQVSKGEI